MPEEATAPTVRKCDTYTRTGAPCRNRAVGGSPWCRVHGGLSVAVTAISDPSPPTAAPTVRTKVALVGFTASLTDAPWGDPEWDVLGCNNLHKQIPDLWPKATGWWNLHAWPEIECDPEHVEWLKQAPFPVWMFPEAIEDARKAGHEFPTAVPFPHREIVTAFSGQLAGARYITNSVSWMTAFAILRIMESGGDGEIALYGIDMATSGEYQSQRPSCEYWLGVAEGAGIKVTVAPRADLLKCAFVYGVDVGGSEFAAKMRARITELEEKLAQANNQWEGLRSQMEQTRYLQHQLAGALEDCRYWDTVWMQQPGNVRQGGADKYSTEAVVPVGVGASGAEQQSDA